MINIDGSQGEGGGQVLRTSLALSIVTGKPFRIFNIRAGRKNPGLQRQHLMAVKAAREVCGGGVKGAELGSKELTFGPGPAVSGKYRFDIGTAGSTTLVFQTVLYPLLAAGGISEVELVGGTHNPMAPSADFLSDTFLPALAALGADASIEVAQVGFYPKGGGILRARIRGAKLRACSLADWGGTKVYARILLARLPDHVAEREIKVLQGQLPLARKDCEIVHTEAASPGNAVMVRIRHEWGIETITVIGEKGKPAEEVAAEAAKAAREYLEHTAPVGEHLADQLLLPMALGAGGSFVTGPISGHTETNIATIKRFLDVKIEVERLQGRRNRIVVNS